MQLYQYHDLTPPATLQAAFDRVTTALRAGDFRAADVKKMVGTPYYRARLSDADRLLFRFARYDGQTCLLLLELILHHAYDKSKFLRGAAPADPGTAPVLLQPADVPAADVQPLTFVAPAPGGGAALPRFHLLDRPLFFDADQQAVFDLPTPLVLIGAAGSGKTALTLEKLKTLVGTPEAPAHGLYVTRSAYLAEHAARLYAAHRPPPEVQEVDFLSLRELVESIQIPAGQEVTAARFGQWFAQHRPHVRLKDGERLFEEFHGVLTGADATRPIRSLADYEALGARQSVFAPEERPAVYALFEKYLAWLAAEGLFNPNIAAFACLPLAGPTYDFVVVDEVQDLTNVQLALILRTLKPAADGAGGRFIVCGDAHQVVHPNFFSWAGLKALFFQTTTGPGPTASPDRQTLHLLRTNYRNSPAVTAVANRLLQVKNLRFGSLDRESTFLIEAAGQRPGQVVFVQETPDAQRNLNERIRRSARFAVLVLREEDKAEARRFFDTPLLFTVHEAKGLEYDNIVLVNCISRHEKLFRDVAEGISPADLTGELRYARPADRADHHAEHYKFVVNALYVAVTRAVESLYVIERHAHHPLLPLLGLTQPRAQAELAAQTSTADEWRQEARKLEQQGRTEQAQAIREQVLGQEQPKWTPLTALELPTLQAQAFNPDHYNRKAKDRLFGYALLYHDQHMLNVMAALDGAQKYNPVRGDKMAALRHLLNKHYHMYQGDQVERLASYVKRYGPNAPDEFGFTPLAAATGAHAWKIVAWLCAQGASLTATDAWGRTPWHFGLYRFAEDPPYVGPHLGMLYELIAPPTLALQYLGHLLTVRASQIEYLLVSYLSYSQLHVIRQKLAVATSPEVRFLEAADLEAFLAWFPDSVVPAHRKTRRYLNALLARHEAGRPAPQSMQLWIRVRPGQYLLNPMLRLESAPGHWDSINTITHLHLGRIPRKLLRADKAIAEQYQRAVDEFLEALEKHRDTLSE